MSLHNRRPGVAWHAHRKHLSVISRKTDTSDNANVIRVFKLLQWPGCPFSFFDGAMGFLIL